MGVHDHCCPWSFATKSALSYVRRVASHVSRAHEQVEDALRLQFSSFRINASTINYAEQSSSTVFSSASTFEATTTNGPTLAAWTPALIEASSLAELVSVHLELSGLQVQVSNEASSFMTNTESLSSATLVAALAPVTLTCTCPTRYASG
jgi:hypothetical protein